MHSGEFIQKMTAIEIKLNVLTAKAKTAQPNLY
jgi:hypothetical protein